MSALQGRPKTTWMQTIRQDLKCIEIKLDLSKATKTLNRLLTGVVLQNELCSTNCG